MKISMIAAVAKNRVIGKDNDLVWHLPDDMRFFVEKTKGHHVIMGRKNWESLPPKFQPLPNRPNLVLSANANYPLQGAVLLHDMEQALDLAKEAGEDEAFIIGGGQIYTIGLDFADRMYITEVDAAPEGDSFYPEFDRDQWKEVSREHHPEDKRHPHAFDFVVYEKV